MALGLSLIVALLLVAATVILHYESLQFAGTLPERHPFPTRARMTIVIAVVLAAHVLEASLYAVAYYLLQIYAGIGGLAGHLEGDLLDFFYSQWRHTRPLALVTCIQVEWCGSLPGWSR